MGMEIRGKVVNFVGEKIRAIRVESNFEKCMNATVIRTNAMRHLP
jgi:tRNA (guanine-N7-)-methyltransferase